MPNFFDEKNPDCNHLKGAQNTFVPKNCSLNVGEIDTFSQFHLHFMSIFCANFFFSKKLQTQTINT